MVIFWRHNVTWKLWDFLAPEGGDFSENSGILQFKQIWPFLGCLVHGLVRFWVAGGTDLKAFNRTVVITINRAKFDCGDIGAHHAFGWEIFLDGKVDNLV